MITELSLLHLEITLLSSLYKATSNLVGPGTGVRISDEGQREVTRPALGSELQCVTVSAVSPHG